MTNAAETEAGENNINICANCGVAEVDDIKLEECDGCDLVLCGSEWCRVVHREQHDHTRKGRKSYTTKKYLHNPTVVIAGSVHSASCRCRLIIKNIHFIHAAAPIFAMAAFMFITAAMETANVHSVESRWLMRKKVTRE